jgi:hypothetical protein
MPRNDNSHLGDGRERPLDQDDRIVISDSDARGGEIILRSRRRRAIFIAGLVGFVILAAVLSFAGLAV